MFHCPLCSFNLEIIDVLLGTPFARRVSLLTNIIFSSVWVIHKKKKWCHLPTHGIVLLVIKYRVKSFYKHK